MLCCLSSFCYLSALYIYSLCKCPFAGHFTTFTSATCNHFYMQAAVVEASRDPSLLYCTSMFLGTEGSRRIIPQEPARPAAYLRYMRYMPTTSFVESWANISGPCVKSCLIQRPKPLAVHSTITSASTLMVCLFVPNTPRPRALLQEISCSIKTKGGAYVLINRNSSGIRRRYES